MITASNPVDIRHDDFHGAATALDGKEAAADSASRLLARLRERGEPPFRVRHPSMRPRAALFLPDTPGADLGARVAPAAR